MRGFSTWKQAGFYRYYLIKVCDITYFFRIQSIHSQYWFNSFVKSKSLLTRPLHSLDSPFPRIPLWRKRICRDNAVAVTAL